MVLETMRAAIYRQVISDTLWPWILRIFFVVKKPPDFEQYSLRFPGISVVVTSVCQVQVTVEPRSPVPAVDSQVSLVLR